MKRQEIIKALNKKEQSFEDWYFEYEDKEIGEAMAVANRTAFKAVRRMLEGLEDMPECFTSRSLIVTMLRVLHNQMINIASEEAHMESEGAIGELMKDVDYEALEGYCEVLFRPVLSMFDIEYKEVSGE